MLKRIVFVCLFIASLGFDALAQVKPPAAAPEEPVPAMAVPPSYKHETQVRRDPFVNPVPKPAKPAVAGAVNRPPGLRGLLLSEADIAGIVWSSDPEMNRAVILAPGGKTYFVQKGQTLFDAVVKEIQRDGVVFELKARNPAGTNAVRDLVRKVRSSP